MTQPETKKLDPDQIFDEKSKQALLMGIKLSGTAADLEAALENYIRPYGFSIQPSWLPDLEPAIISAYRRLYDLAFDQYTPPGYNEEDGIRDEPVQNVRFQNAFFPLNHLRCKVLYQIPFLGMLKSFRDQLTKVDEYHLLSDE